MASKNNTGIYLIIGIILVIFFILPYFQNNFLGAIQIPQTLGTDIYLPITTQSELDSTPLDQLCGYSFQSSGCVTEDEYGMNPSSAVECVTISSMQICNQKPICEQQAVNGGSVVVEGNTVTYVDYEDLLNNPKALLAYKSSLIQEKIIKVDSSFFKKEPPKITNGVTLYRCPECLTSQQCSGYGSWLIIESQGSCITSDNSYRCGITQQQLNELSPSLQQQFKDSNIPIVSETQAQNITSTAGTNATTTTTTSGTTKTSAITTANVYNSVKSMQMWLWYLIGGIVILMIIKGKNRWYKGRNIYFNFIDRNHLGFGIGVALGILLITANFFSITEILLSYLNVVLESTTKLIVTIIIDGFIFGTVFAILQNWLSKRRGSK